MSDRSAISCLISQSTSQQVLSDRQQVLIHSGERYFLCITTLSTSALFTYMAG